MSEKDKYLKCLKFIRSFELANSTDVPARFDDSEEVREAWSMGYNEALRDVFASIDNVLQEETTKSKGR